MEQLTADQAARARELAHAVVAQVERVIVGKHDVVELCLTALLARGHVLIEDMPGVGKTMLAKSMAKAVKCSFKRIQFTPDLLPGDVTGITVYNQKSAEFIFNPGPVFANIVLADEINRATPKTQSALLESMEEAQVTAEGLTRPLPHPFFVMATQNPIEYRGTYPLPEAQMDRFLMRLRMGYPQREEEIDLLARQHAASATPSGSKAASQSAAVLQLVEPVLDSDAICDLQTDRMRVHVSTAIRNYIVELVHGTRGHFKVALGASPRASLALQRASQAAALVGGREYVIADDVKRLAKLVLSHRLILHEDTRPGADEDAADAVIQQLLNEVPVPA